MKDGSPLMPSVGESPGGVSPLFTPPKWTAGVDGVGGTGVAGTGMVPTSDSLGPSDPRRRCIVFIGGRAGVALAA